MFLEYGLASATVAVGWSGYLVSLLGDNIGIHIPAALTAAPGVLVKNAAGVVVATGVVNLPAMIIVILVTTLLVVGVSESARVNNIIVAIKLTVVIAFIGIGAFYVHPHLWSPLVPAQIPAPPPGTPMDFWHQIGRALVNIVTGNSHSRYGMEGVVHAAAVIFFAYLGFEAVSTAGAESKNPARDMPIGILGALVICTILYIMTSAVLVGIVPYAVAGQSRADRRGGERHRSAVVRGAGEDRRACRPLERRPGADVRPDPHLLHHVARRAGAAVAGHRASARFKTPWINTLIVGAIVCCATGFLSLDVLGDVTNVGSLTAFALVCITVIYLRWSNPGSGASVQDPALSHHARSSAR